MFLFPFITDGQASAPQSNRTVSLPMLPAPRSAARASVSGEASDLASLGVEIIRQSLATLTSSLTALGTRTNALFAQVAAGLALDRATRATAAAFGTYAQPRTAPHALTFGFPLQAPAAAFPAVPESFFNPWQGNPWTPFAQMLDFWAKIGNPVATGVNPYAQIAASPASLGGLPWAPLWTPQR